MHLQPHTKMKKLVVLTGAGISAESGISTFRDANGLWEGHDVTQVASPEGWRRDRELVLDFYNQRRKNVLEAEPNAGHKILVELEEHFDVQIITQNVDDLHERAGSSNVLHLHGELRKARSTKNPNYVREIEGWQLKLGDKAPDGSQLRPHIVWFGEMVPMIEPAAALCTEADVFLIVGTSLAVYPAASLGQFVPDHVPQFLVDPKRPDAYLPPQMTFIAEKATTGMVKVKEALLQML